MLRVTAITAVGASRRSLLAGLQHQCSRQLAQRAYSTAESSSFSIHTPKASKRNNRRDATAGKKHPNRTDRPYSGQRSFPSSSTSFALSRTKRVLALGHRQPQNASTSSRTTNSQLIALQRAIDGQDITSISSAWHQLGHHVDELGQVDHRKLLRLCTSYSSSIRDPDQAQSWHGRFRDFATAASLTGDVELICGWFRVLLANGQAQDVVNIWQDVVRIRLESGPNASSSIDDSDAPESTTTDQTSGDSFVRLDASMDGDRIDIHDMVCLVAFACNTSRPTSNSVELFEKVEFGSPFRLFFNISRAQRLFESTPVSGANTPPDWDTMQTRLWDIELARGLSSGSGGPQRIARLLGSLFQMQQIDSAYNIFQTAMRASAQPDAWLSLEPLGQQTSSSSPPTSTSRAQWTESCWSVCLSNLIAAGRTQLAMDVWTHLQQKRLHSTPRIWNALLDGYGRAKNHTAAAQTWAAAIAQASSQNTSSPIKLPDEQMYTTMIDIYFRSKMVDEAMALFMDMRANSDRQGGQLHVQAETFNAVLHGLFLNGAHAQAQSLLEQMLAKGPAPIIGTINTFLRAHGRIGDLESMATTLRLADKLKLTPDVVTFTTILDALLRKGGESATAAVVKTLDLMNSMGVQPNVVTYTAMIKACLVGAEAAQLDLASQSLLGNSTDRKRRELSSNDVRIEAALELLERLVKAKVAPSEITYSALIGGCLQNPDAVAHAFATKTVPRQFCSLPKPLHRLGESQQTVQQWSQELPQVSLSLLLLEQMKGRGLPPTAPTFRYLIEGLCSTHTDQAAFVRAMDFVDDMLLRTTVLEPSRRLGPFATAVLKGTEEFPPTMHAPNHKTWILVFSSLINRLENGPRDRLAMTTCGRALVLATRLVREMGSLAGAEGGLSLSRLVERAASLMSKMPR
ncbi:uncharacterized protein SRS1_15610 [Sporisorium reilianum f. sp. reilianum]|uniref:Uncharacterized protein n=1 Tax=Sporisorium reilianum f. sp. reilianum TaxID=72559 RepID=A0A2N8UKP3_9BASI|nr:uncharacterized protein SRS1_15610 [Sporisorium reilianum f. sp. reilianum]